MNFRAPIAATLFAVVLCPIVTVGATKLRPNIIFIMTDDHAAHAISAYGSKVNQTPHMDRIGREGIRFDGELVVYSI